jgi:hypothetical protein
VNATTAIHFHSIHDRPPECLWHIRGQLDSEQVLNNVQRKAGSLHVPILAGGPFIHPEGNLLMATLLDLGDIPFLAVKVAIGVVAAYSFWNWSQFKLARYGLSAALVAYGAVMGIHILTGLTVVGVISSSLIQNVTAWSKAVLMLFS